MTRGDWGGQKLVPPDKVTNGKERRKNNQGKRAVKRGRKRSKSQKRETETEPRWKQPPLDREKCPQRPQAEGGDKGNP